MEISTLPVQRCLPRPKEKRKLTFFAVAVEGVCSAGLVVLGHRAGGFEMESGASPRGEQAENLVLPKLGSELVSLESEQC